MSHTIRWEAIHVASYSISSTLHASCGVSGNPRPVMVKTPSRPASTASPRDTAWIWRGAGSGTSDLLMTVLVRPGSSGRRVLATNQAQHN